MNALIEEFAKQCTEVVDSTTTPAITEFDYEKFAELIIMECATVMNNNDFEGRHIGDVLKRHFGVE